VSPTIVAESAESLAAYASVSIAFETAARVDTSLAATSSEIRTRPLPSRVSKDYDAYPGSHPLDWRTRFDVAQWTFLAAYYAGVRVGGAVVVADDPQIELLEHRRDLALLWDLRVAPDARGRGIGSALICVAQDWAWSKGCSEIRVETQDINVAACRAYARHGFHVHSVDPDAYPDLPDEVQLLWSAPLAGMPD
jgi:GNAT superfamily N-acetyltransferase